MKTLSDYEEVVRAIDDLAMFAEKHTLSHTRRFLEVLGNPDEACPAVHVAGTNGKGSVCAFMERVLREAGLKTALFTSPHLTDIRERMRIGGEMISREAFCRVYQHVREAADDLKAGEGLHEPSYFEFLYLMAAVWFAEEGAEIAVIETGLGGRLDCTNTLRRPLVTVITSVSLDHMQYLGNTVREIAGEKAGIMKTGVPCVYEAKKAEAAEVLAGRAREMGIRTLPVGPEDYKVLQNSHGAIDFSLSTRYDVGGAGVYTLAFAAPYQAENAALAVTALAELKRQGETYTTENDFARPGIRRDAAEAGDESGRLPESAGAGEEFCRLPESAEAGEEFCRLPESAEAGDESGRLPESAEAGEESGQSTEGAGDGHPRREELAVIARDRRARTLKVLSALDRETVRRGLASTAWAGRMEEILPDVYLDGAHNEDGIRRFAEAALSIAGDRRRILLFAAVADKDYTDMIAALAAALVPDRVFVTEIAGKRRRAAESFAEEFQRRGIGDVSAFPDVSEAFQAALGARGDGLLFICGSLYLAGLLKAELAGPASGR